MFEIHGLFKKADKDKIERLKKHVTSYSFLEDRYTIPQIPPLYGYYEELIKRSEKVILSFQYKQFYNLPQIPYPYLAQVLPTFLPVKEKVLVEFSAACPDWNIRKGYCHVLSNNQAVLKYHVKNATLFFSELYQASYFTYLDEENSPHIVWLEDTKSLSIKHNLIKKSGFRGIAWNDPVLASDGNWEALSVIYKQKDSDSNKIKDQTAYELPYPS